MTELTAERLRELLDYEPDTGILRWRVRNSNRALVGSVAGTLQGGRGNGIGVQINGTIYKAHRLIWLHVYGHWPTKEIDHINGCPTDNRLANLREADRSQNNANQKCRVDSKSGLKGVHWNHKKYWQAYLRKNGRRIILGNFRTKEEAHAAYCVAASLIHGEFARAA